MALTHTPFCNTAFEAPDFSLKSTDGKTYSLADVQGKKGTVVAFICNHCPYVKAITTRLVEAAAALQKKDIGFVAIMSNDTEKYPDDSFENMITFSKEHAFSFPYLIDETQEIAKSYDAVCTPDFFGFNADMKLHYRGRLDAVNPSHPATEDTKLELYDAMMTIAETGKGPEDQNASMGCSIKWRADDAA